MKASPRMSPTLSGLLNDVVYKEEEVEMSPEEASLLQEEINNISEQIESDTTDLSIVSKSLNRVLELTEDMNTAVDTDTTDKHTAGLLLSEFASIYKDTMGQEFLYPKNLSDNPLEVKQVLTAGLQSAGNFIETLKKIVKKIWESLKAAFKWFWSKIKQFVSWLFGRRRKIEEQIDENEAVVDILNAAAKTADTFKGKEDTATEEEISKELDINLDRARKKHKDKAKKIFDDLADKFNDIREELYEFDKKVNEFGVSVDITFGSSRVANKILLGFVDKIEQDRVLQGNIAAMAAIASASSAFSFYQDSVELKDGLNLREIIFQKADIFGAYSTERLSTVYEGSHEWIQKIDKEVFKDNDYFVSKKNKIGYVQEIFLSLFDIGLYDNLCGVSTIDNKFNLNIKRNGIVNILVSYLQDFYNSYLYGFKQVNEIVADIDSKNNSDPERIKKRIKQLGYTSFGTEKHGLLGYPVINVAAMPTNFNVEDNGKVSCNWINYYISGQSYIRDLDLKDFKDDLLKESKNLKDNHTEFVQSGSTMTALNILKNGTKDGVILIGQTTVPKQSTFEKDLIKQIDNLGSGFSALIKETDVYIDWFQKVDSALISSHSGMFDNLFKFTEHISKIQPSLPLNMLKKNQDILDSIFKTINFKDEAIAAFREYLKEKQEERYQ